MLTIVTGCSTGCNLSCSHGLGTNPRLVAFLQIVSIFTFHGKSIAACILNISQSICIQRKFRNLTSDCTESCRHVLKHRCLTHRCLTAEMFYSTDAGHERFWRVGIARNVCFSIVLWLRRLAKPASGVAEDRLPKMSRKFAPRCGVRAIWKSKPLEAELRQICTTVWRESDLDERFGGQNRSSTRCSGCF